MRYRWSFSLAVVCYLVSGSSGADSWRDAEYLEGLRARRLYGLAADYCARTLQRTDIAAARRVELTVEWQRTLAMLARDLPPAERGPVWEQAHALRTAFPDADPGRELVGFQDALVWLAEGEQARWEVEGAPPGGERWEQVRRPLRQAVVRLERLERLHQVPPASTIRRAGQEASGNDRLARPVAVALARAFRIQAAAYPPRSPDAVEALMQAVLRLESIANAPYQDATTRAARLDLVACQRELGRLTEAAALLDAMPATLPPQLERRRQLEWIRLELARRDVSAAEDRVAAAPSWKDGEWEFAQLEILLARLEQADETLRERLFQQAAARIDSLEDRHGPYWMRRGELRLAQLVAEQGSGAASALLRAASGYARAGQWAAALEAYDAAGRRAREAGDGKTAFEAAFAAAELTRDQQQLAVAARRLVALALEFRRHERAGHAHQLAIYHTAELARGSETAERSQRLAEYRSLLLEHVAIWPDDRSTPEVRRWLADLFRANQEWELALEQYLSIAPLQEPFAESLVPLIECWQQVVHQAEAGGPRRAAEAAQRLTAMAEQIGEQTREHSQLSWTARVAAGEFLVSQLDTGQQGSLSMGPAESLLSRLDEVDAELPPPLVAEARALRTVALAALARMGEARHQARQLNLRQAETVLVLLERLGRLTGPEVADLRSELAERLAPGADQLPMAQRRRLTLQRAIAAVASGRRSEGVALLRELATAAPDDVPVLRAFAATLAASEDVDELRGAVTQYVRIERQLAAGTDLWLEARLRRAELLYKLGVVEQAAKLIRITQVFYPTLGGPDLASQFQALLDGQ